MSVFDVGFPDPFVSGFIGHEEDLSDDDDENITLNNEKLEWTKKPQCCKLLCLATTAASQAFVKLHFLLDAESSTSNVLELVEAEKHTGLVTAAEIAEDDNKFVFAFTHDLNFINEKHCNSVGQRLMDYCNDQTKIVVLSSFPMSNFVGEKEDEDNLLRSLHNVKEEGIKGVKMLEKKNVVVGVPASVMTLANSMDMSALMLVLFHADYPDFDSLSLTNFDALFETSVAKQLGLKKAKIDKEKMRRVKKENLTANMFV